MAFKYRTQAELNAFLEALELISQQSLKMAELLQTANVTMLANPLHESALPLGLSALQVALEEMEGMGALFEQHAVRLMGEARREGEKVIDYVARINDMDIPATMKRRGFMLMPW
jgi:hypothetical protein